MVGKNRFSWPAILGICRAAFHEPFRFRVLKSGTCLIIGRHRAAFTIASLASTPERRVLTLRNDDREGLVPRGLLPRCCPK